uniref:Muscle M-line assembly protein unc-89 n=1 Tax=Dracunculus medinensis TaxID=318479 RepID=A0A0N4UAZ5_DRAME
LEVYQSGNAKVEKEDGEIGYIPTYFLEMDSIPGENFAEQIRYRREWYQYLDGNTGKIYDDDDNTSSLINSLTLHPSLASFISTHPFHPLFYENLRPKCIEQLKDINVREHEKFELRCSFVSSKPFTITWRGPAITRKNDCFIENDNSGNFSLTVREALSEDSGQYWVEAENVDGKDHTVAWVQVLSKPGTPHSLDYKIIEENTIQLDWSESRKDEDKYQVAVESLTKPSAVIDGLVPCVTYFFRVFAFNESVQSEPSLPREVIITMDVYRSMAIKKFYKNFEEPISYLNGDIDGFYLIKELVGRGRYADVKLVTYKTTGRKFAAKYFRQYSCVNDFEALEEIEREIRLVRIFHHANIVAYRAAIRTDNRIILVMQWAGIELIDYIINLGYLSETILRNLFRGLFEALKYLHFYELAHLDIKVKLQLLKRCMPRKPFLEQL